MLRKFNMDTFEDGEIQILSYQKPVILPGSYDITVNQTIKGPKDFARPLQTTKPLRVLAPSQFALPANCVHSFYPAPGEAVQSCILPHVVLANAYIPWEQNGQKKH